MSTLTKLEMANEILSLRKEINAVRADRDRLAAEVERLRAIITDGCWAGCIRKRDDATRAALGQEGQ